MSILKSYLDEQKKLIPRQYVVVCHREPIPGDVSYVRDDNGEWKFDGCPFFVPSNTHCMCCVTALTGYLNNAANTLPPSGTQFELELGEEGCTLRLLKDN